MFKDSTHYKHLQQGILINTLSAELRVAIALYEKQKSVEMTSSEFSGLTFLQLQALTESFVNIASLSRALDILLDFGCIAPDDDWIEIEENGKVRKFLARVYRVSGEFKMYLKNFAELIDRIHGAEQQEESAPVSFRSTKFISINNLKRDLAIIAYMIWFTQKKQGVKELPGMFATKLAANLFLDLKDEPINHDSIVEVVPRQYGYMPILPKGQLDRDYPILRYPHSHWVYDGTRRRIRSSWKDMTTTKIQDFLITSGVNDQLLGTVEDFIDLYLTIMMFTPIGRSYPEEVINILATSRTETQTVQSYKFEFLAFRSWCELFFETANMFNAAGEIQKQLIQQCLEKAKKLPSYDTHPFYLFECALNVERQQAGRIWSDFEVKLKNSSEPVSRNNLHTEFLALILAQATTAAGQMHKKLEDWETKMPKIRNTVSELAKDGKRYAHALSKKLTIFDSRFNDFCRDLFQVSFACSQFVTLTRCLYSTLRTKTTARTKPLTPFKKISEVTSEQLNITINRFSEIQKQPLFIDVTLNTLREVFLAICDRLEIAVGNYANT